MGKHITDFSAVTTVGLELAKHVFQIHAIDASGSPASGSSRIAAGQCGDLGGDLVRNCLKKTIW
jgi:hypothetical protein